MVDPEALPVHSQPTLQIRTSRLAVTHMKLQAHGRTESKRICAGQNHLLARVKIGQINTPERGRSLISHNLKIIA